MTTRLGFVTRKFPPTLSGMSTYALNFCKHMLVSGVDLRVFVQYRPDDLGRSGYGDAPPQALPGAEVIGMPQRHEIAAGDFEQDIHGIVETLVAQHRHRPFDVLHAQYGYPTGVATVLAAGEIGVPAIVSMQGGDGHWFGTCCDHHAGVLRWLISNASVVLFPTESFRERVVARAGEPKSSHVLPGAVDVERFRFSENARKDWRGRLGLTENDSAVIFHGRLDLRKGLLELITGLATLRRSEGPPFKLIMAGAGPDAEAVLAKADACLGVENFEYAGQLSYDDMPGLLSAGEIHCSPTYQEGFSNTLVEAAACSLPLVTTDAVGVRDVFTHGHTAWLMQPESEVAVCEAVRQLLSDAALRRHLSANARQLVMDHYSWSTLTANILALYSRQSPVEELNQSVVFEGVDRSCRFRKNPLLL